MAAVGWVAAQVDAGEAPTRWVRLSVFDDGWVEIPTFGRTFSAVRGDLRATLRLVVLMALGVGAVVALGVVAGHTDGSVATTLRVASLLLFVAGIVWATVTLQRRRVAQWGRNSDDRAELRRMRTAGTLPRIAPGASRWRRATSASDLATRLLNTTLVAAADVASVSELPVADQDRRVEVRLHSGTARRYRSPDPRLGRLLLRFGTDPRPSH